MSDNTLFELATAGSCFRVFDVETCVGHDGFRRIVSLGITEVRNGVVTAGVDESPHWFFNPGIRIDDRSYGIHGISNADVDDEPFFADVASEVLEALTQPPAEDPTIRVVWVAHYASFDVSALAWACEQAGVEMPDVPVLDTARIPRLLAEDVPAFETINSRHLPNLADHYGVGDGHKHHDAASDAHATALVFREMVREVVGVGLGLESVLATATSSRDYTAKGNVSRHAPVHPTQSDEHVGAHPDQLPDTLTTATRNAWARQFLACSLVACEHVRILSDEFERHPTLLKDVFRISKTTLPPGSIACNTMLGAVSDPAIISTLSTQRTLITEWLKWRAKMKPQACPQPQLGIVEEHDDQDRESPESGEPAATQCPDCREGEPCPADVLHQSLARVLVGLVNSRNDRVPNQRITNYAKADPLRNLTSRGAGDVAGFVAWLCVDQAQKTGQLRQASTIMARAHQNHLDQIEPRLALLAAARLIATDKRGEARDLCEAVLAQISTDLAYAELLDFYQQHLLPPREDVPRVLKTKPRYGPTVRRPADRRYTPRFKVG